MSTHTNIVTKEWSCALAVFISLLNLLLLLYYLDDDLLYVPNWQFKLLFPSKCSQLAFISCLYLMITSTCLVFLHSHDIPVILLLPLPLTLNFQLIFMILINNNMWDDFVVDFMHANLFSTHAHVTISLLNILFGMTCQKNLNSFSFL